jgi:hypothetical protein
MYAHQIFREVLKMHGQAQKGYCEQNHESDLTFHEVLRIE